jgi:methylenetetrahydrofolate reductase (NADPH)
MGQMQFIKDIYKSKDKSKAVSGQPVISFELFPPKTAEGDAALLEKTLPALAKLRPDYCSVTYGAGGSTQEKSFMIVDRLQRTHNILPLAHLTCVNATREDIGKLLEQARALGVKNILALRGDPPGGLGEFQPIEGGFEFAYQLVQFIRDLGGFCLGVAGFPEGHIACREGKHVDWQRLKTKVDTGADFVLTQLFFDNRDFFEFRDYMTKLGVTVPLCPGIIPILSNQQIQRFTALCGARIPAPLLGKLEELGDDQQAVADYGIEYATRQCEELLRQGCPGLHFYTLNKARSTTAVLKNLGLAD